MCNNRSLFISYNRLPSPITIKLGDDTTVTTTYYGLAYITQDLQLDALYSLTFRLSLLSISRLERVGYPTTFRHGKCFRSTDKKSTASIITANRIGDLYILQSPNALASKAISTNPNVALQSEATTSSRKKGKKNKQSQTTKMTADLTPTSTITARLWHQRIAHLHPAAMQFLIDRLNNPDETMCHVCLQARHKQKCILTRVKRATTPFELVNSDSCGCFSVLTKGRHLHYIIFVDDYTRWTTFYLLPDMKRETCIAACQHYQANVDARGYNIKRF